MKLKNSSVFSLQFDFTSGQINLLQYMLNFYLLGFFPVFHSVLAYVWIWILGMTNQLKKSVYFVPWGSGTARCD